MKDNCQFIEGCPMFRHFRRHAQETYVMMFCKGQFYRCKRRELRLAGEAVPQDLLPHGARLWKR